jgi:hypothetical protein
MISLIIYLLDKKCIRNRKLINSQLHRKDQNLLLWEHMEIIPEERSNDWITGK